MRQPCIDAGRICNVCKEFKLISEYSPNKQCSLGVVGTCKPCANKRVAQWYKDNRKRRQNIANDKNRNRKNRAIEVFGGKCFDCDGVFPSCVYQFHHLDSSKKDVNPSYAMTGSDERMWNELSKCVMLCANCHMIRHHTQSDTTERKEGQ
jgi:hypothetical protein